MRGFHSAEFITLKLYPISHHVSQNVGIKTFFLCTHPGSAFIFHVHCGKMLLMSKAVGSQVKRFLPKKPHQTCMYTFAFIIHPWREGEMFEVFHHKKISRYWKSFLLWNVIYFSLFVCESFSWRIRNFSHYSLVYLRGRLRGGGKCIKWQSQKENCMNLQARENCDKVAL